MKVRVKVLLLKRSRSWLGGGSDSEDPSLNSIAGALIIRIGFWGVLYYEYILEPK